MTRPRFYRKNAATYVEFTEDGTITRKEKTYVFFTVHERYKKDRTIEVQVPDKQYAFSGSTPNSLPGCSTTVGRSI